VIWSHCKGNFQIKIFLKTSSLLDVYLIFRIIFNLNNVQKLRPCRMRQNRLPHGGVEVSWPGIIDQGSFKQGLHHSHHVFSIVRCGTSNASAVHPVEWCWTWRTIKASTKHPFVRREFFFLYLINFRWGFLRGYTK